MTKVNVRSTCDVPIKGLRNSFGVKNEDDIVCDNGRRLQKRSNDGFYSIDLSPNEVRDILTLSIEDNKPQSPGKVYNYNSTYAECVYAWGVYKRALEGDTS